MARQYRHLKAIVCKEPKIIYECYSRKKMLFFSMCFTDKNKKGFCFNVVVASGEKYPIYETFKEHCSVGDIYDIIGYETKIKGLGYEKPIRALRVRKFKPLWNNALLLKIACNEIRAYESINGSIRNTNKIIDSLNINDGLKNFLKVRKEKTKKKDRVKGIITHLQLNKAFARHYYLDGNKYLALALMIENKYISITKLNKKESILYRNEINLYTKCDFKPCIDA